MKKKKTIFGIIAGFAVIAALAFAPTNTPGWIWDIRGLSTISLNSSQDFVSVYDSSALLWRKMKVNSFIGSTAWLLGGNTTGANANAGTLDGYRYGITTNGTARQYYSSDGRIFSGTVTDWRMTPTDTAELRVGGNSWLISTAFSRLIANSLIAWQVNHSTGAQAAVLPDNTSSAYTMSISGGATAISVNSTDGGEITGVGTSSSGGTLNLVSEKTITAGSHGIALRTITAAGTTALAQGDFYIRLDATAGAQTITLPSPSYNMVLKFKRIDNNAATAIIFTGTVDGTTNPNSTTGGSPIIGLATQYGNLELTWNGTNWDVSE